MTSMDRAVLVAMFRALHQAEQGHAGFFGVAGAAPNGTRERGPKERAARVELRSNLRWSQPWRRGGGE